MEMQNADGACLLAWQASAIGTPAAATTAAQPCGAPMASTHAAVTTGTMLATGCKRINWETRATNIRLWLMLAAAKLKLLAIRARKRMWKPGSAAVA